MMATRMVVLLLLLAVLFLAVLFPRRSCAPRPLGPLFAPGPPSPVGVGGQGGATGVVVALVEEVRLSAPLVAQPGQNPAQPLAQVGEVDRRLGRRVQLAPQG